MALFLIIEPDEAIRLLYAEIVRRLGHETAFSANGTDPEPDVVLAEPADPKSFETTLRLRLARPDLAIVCASVYEPVHDEIRVLRPSAYLLKPFRLVELTDALQLALSQKRPLSEWTERVARSG
jgi:CheY-like chemotaxis protein